MRGTDEGASVLKWTVLTSFRVSVVEWNPQVHSSIAWCVVGSQSIETSMFDVLRWCVYHWKVKCDWVSYRFRYRLATPPPLSQFEKKIEKLENSIHYDPMMECCNHNENFDEIVQLSYFSWGTLTQPHCKNYFASKYSWWYVLKAYFLNRWEYS